MCERMELSPLALENRLHTQRAIRAFVDVSYTDK